MLAGNEKSCLEKYNFKCDTYYTEIEQKQHNLIHHLSSKIKSRPESLSGVFLVPTYNTRIPDHKYSKSTGSECYIHFIHKPQ